MLRRGGEIWIFICVAVFFAILGIANGTTEPVPDLEASEQKIALQANSKNEENAQLLLDVDAGVQHADETNREVRQFGRGRGRGFGRTFGFGGFGRPFYGGFRPYGGFYRPPFYGGYYRPPFYGGFYRPPPFFYRPYYGFGPGFYG